FLHFSHLKSWPEKLVFWAAPLPTCFFVIFSVWMNVADSDGLTVWQRKQIKDCLEDLVFMIRRDLQVGQNWRVILGLGREGF
ncbi:MAG: hypothetical protein MI922_09735, partial [Bacteroidales bacterium]|nr:hypothetical protein [Bacteroidales bacterium]